MPSFEIVSLSPEDWPQFKALRLEALKNEPQAYSSTYQGNLQNPDSSWQVRLEAAAQAERSWLLFARKQDRLVGLVGAFIEDGSDIADIVSMYVTRDERGQGIGKALMTAILDKLRTKGSIKSARLGVNISQVVAVNLYSSLGFTKIDKEYALMGDGKNYIECVMEMQLK